MVDRPLVQAVRRFLETGIVLARGDPGVVAALLAEDPEEAGAFGGAGRPIARTLAEAAREFMTRTLSARERLRVAAVLICAARRAAANLEAGQTVRQDDFFTSGPGLRSTADEVVEGTLIAAQREHEEQKLSFLGNLLANLAFRQYIDRAQANLLVAQAASLSYRQLGLVALFAERGRFRLRSRDFVNEPRVPFETVAVLQEIMEMERRGFVVQRGCVLQSLVEIIPDQIELNGPGVQLYRRMGLEEMDAADVTGLAELLRFRGVAEAKEWVGEREPLRR